MNFGPLSLRINAGAPRSHITSLRGGVHVRGRERLPAGQDQRLTGKFVRQGQDFESSAVDGFIEDEILGPDLVRPLCLRRDMLSGSNLSGFALRGKREVFALPALMDGLSVDWDAFTAQRRVNPAASPAGMLRGQGPNPRHQFTVMTRTRHVPIDEAVWIRRYCSPDTSVSRCRTTRCCIPPPGTTLQWTVRLFGVLEQFYDLFLTELPLFHKASSLLGGSQGKIPCLAVGEPMVSSQLCLIFGGQTSGAVGTVSQLKASQLKAVEWQGFSLNDQCRWRIRFSK